MIAPTAIVHPGARLHDTVSVGEFSIVGHAVTIGEGCQVGNRVTIAGNTTIGKTNTLYDGCCIGYEAQDMRSSDEHSRIVIGDRNTFRENVTIHLPHAGHLGVTAVGDDCMIMVNAHIGHGAQLGNGVVLVVGSMVGGNANIGSGAYISGGCLVHQDCRVGRFALMQGGAAISMDMPPYTVCARGKANNLCGINHKGMERAGIKFEDRRQVTRLYRMMNGGPSLGLVLTERLCPAAKEFYDFVKSSSRGVCRKRGFEIVETSGHV